MTSTLTPSDVERIADLDATAQAALVRSGELTATDLVHAAIEQVERLDPLVNAVCVKAYDEALRAAEDLPAGPFTGVPYLLKDLGLEMAGLPLQMGSRFLLGNVSTQDSTLVSRLKAAGLVVIGRSASCEFGLSPTVETQAFGAVHNPWDLTRTTGGSSGGSAAAVAARMVPMAGGSDAGGSIRIPASACNLFGLKPSRARTPYGPRYGEFFGGVATEHAVTRSVRDSAALLDATAGPALGDPYAVPPPVRPYVDEVGAPVGPLRIAVTTRPPDGRVADAACVQAALATARLLEELGHEVFERDLVELTPEVGAAIGTMYGACADWLGRSAAEIAGRELDLDELEPLTRLFVENGRKVTGGEFLEAMTVLQSFSRSVAEAMSSFDLWLSPTLGTLPPSLGAMVGTEDNPTRGGEVAAQFVAFPLITANLTGNPAMSVPLGWHDGLPVGSHFMAPYGGEGVLFRLAAQLEEASPWGDRRPRLQA